ncbi:MAG: SLC45 family MFS transporter [Merismopedia sp. SIO2A8]|nr:SLC45 family MFS transporter [Symploca sp. SIO2B6]NET48077.1 SLC45 family MFS transporter [Merismopedia sp. SIO2A8]
MTGWQIINMNMGFLGIQFAWGLQMANMSAIFERLGANAHQLPMLWLAAPMTGLVVQPIIGNLSDYTWTPLGRRRPYFLVGALLASVALVLIPHCFHLWEVVLLLWLLDTSANVSGVPFRAFVGDLLPKQQQTLGFALQSVMVGLGAVSASAFPWVLSHWFNVERHGLDPLLQTLPATVEFSFYAGAIAFLLTILWTIATTPEHPPPNTATFTQLQAERGGIIQSIQEVWTVSLTMPPVMKQLAWVQFFSWLGAFCFFLYFPPAVAHNIFGAIDQHSGLYERGIEWAGICFALFNTVCILFSLVLPTLVQWSDRRTVHSFSLLCGGVSLVALAGITNPYLLLVAMVGFGITWASMLSLPFAMLSGVIPSKRQGIYQGIFNFFIVIPEIFVSLGFGWVMEHWLHDNRLIAVVVGGFFILVAAILTQWVAQPVAADQLPSSSN